MTSGQAYEPRGDQKRPSGPQFTRSREVDPSFFVDFHHRPDGPARAHETRLRGGDRTGEIFL